MVTISIGTLNYCNLNIWLQKAMRQKSRLCCVISYGCDLVGHHRGTTSREPGDWTRSTSKVHEASWSIEKCRKSFLPDWISPRKHYLLDDWRQSALFEVRSYSVVQNRPLINQVAFFSYIEEFIVDTGIINSSLKAWALMAGERIHSTSIFQGRSQTYWAVFWKFGSPSQSEDFWAFTTWFD
jgi:hypothetical protein